MNRMKTLVSVTGAILLAGGIALSSTACSGGNKSEAVQHSDVQAAIARFQQKVPETAQYFNNAYGYAVFPGVGKGALVLGGAYGGGEVYRQGQWVGDSTITKFSIGPQAGGKTFSEVIFFQNAQTFNHFTGGNYQFSANATAAGVQSGVTANNNYSNGVLVFTMTQAGLMAGANIGGQKFSFTPKEKVQAQNRNQTGNNAGYGANAVMTRSQGYAAPAGSGNYGTNSGMNNNGTNNGMNNNGVNNGAGMSQHKQLKQSDVQSAIAKFKQKNPRTQGYFNNAYAYAVFPGVGKGAMVIGGAHGEGSVFKQGTLVGHTTITKFSIGPQAGGQSFREVIFFKNADAFNRFTGGNFQFSANASAVAATAGGSTSNDYSNGVAVFTMTRAGLMAGASIGGQKFSYTPVASTAMAPATAPAQATY